ncbi:hypothetical protein EMN47_06940 [Prolixibacteraceae bacterium JC049]|nr:hypothetical protein [Prolixibacteraceae bacterium JC049]
MKLLPNYFKRIGWIAFVASFILTSINNWDETRNSFWEGWYNGVDKVMPENVLIQKPYEYLIVSGWHWIFDITAVVAVLLVCFAADKNEDELMSKLRLESVAIATIIWTAVFLLIHAITPDLNINISILSLLPILTYLIVFGIKKQSIYL